MQRNSLFALLAVALVLIVSCGRSDKSALAVPKDAGIVLHINANSLSSKLSWKEIQATNWFKEAYKDADDTLAKKLLDDPGSSGIDSQGDLVFFAKRQGKGGYGAFAGTLKDPAAFEAFNKKMKPSATSSKDGDLNILSIENGIATWKDGRFIYLFDSPEMGAAASFGNGGQSSSFPKDSLVAFAKGLYDLKGDNSLGNDDRFASLIKETGDVHMWISAENLTGGLASGMMSMMKFNTLMEGNITTMTMNFDNGKIDVKSKSYYNKELAKLYDKYRMKKIDGDMLSRVASDNVCGVFAMNYPPDGLKEFIKLLGVDGMANGFLGEVGYSMDEFVKANKGDLILAVSDFEIKTEEVTTPPMEQGGQPYTYKKTEPSVKVLFGVSINDKPAFDKMIGIVKAKMGEMPEGRDPKISYALNDKWFAAGNDEAQVNKFIAGGANNKQTYVSKLSGQPMGFYVDLQKVLKGAAPAVTDSTGKIAMAESLKVWEDILMTGGEFSNNSTTGHFEINFVDKNTNSLKQLNQYIDKIAALKHAKPKDVEMEETAPTTPPAQ